MIFAQYHTVLTYIAAGIVLLIAARFFMKPLKAIFKMAIKGAGTLLLLLGMNFFLSPVGFSIGINAVTIAACFLLGLPGLITMILLQIVGI